MYTRGEKQKQFSFNSTTSVNIHRCIRTVAQTAAAPSRPVLLYCTPQHCFETTRDTVALDRSPTVDTETSGVEEAEKQANPEVPRRLQYAEEQR